MLSFSAGDIKILTLLFKNLSAADLFKLTAVFLEIVVSEVLVSLVAGEVVVVVVCAAVGVLAALLFGRCTVDGVVVCELLGLTEETTSSLGLTDLLGVMILPLTVFVLVFSRDGVVVSSGSSLRLLSSGMFIRSVASSLLVEIGVILRDEFSGVGELESFGRMIAVVSLVMELSTMVSVFSPLK